MTVCLLVYYCFSIVCKGAFRSAASSPTFFKHHEILVPEVESYLEGFMCETCAKSVYFYWGNQ